MYVRSRSPTQIPSSTREKSTYATAYSPLFHPEPNTIFNCIVASFIVISSHKQTALAKKN